MAVRAWSVEQVLKWLKQLNPVFERYEKQFTAQGVDGDALLLLDDQKLAASLGVESNVHRFEIISSLEELRQSEATRSAAVASEPPTKKRKASPTVNNSSNSSSSGGSSSSVGDGESKVAPAPRTSLHRLSDDVLLRALEWVSVAELLANVALVDRRLGQVVGGERLWWVVLPVQWRASAEHVAAWVKHPYLSKADRVAIKQNRIWHQYAVSKQRKVASFEHAAVTVDNKPLLQKYQLSLPWLLRSFIFLDPDLFPVLKELQHTNFKSGFCFEDGAADMMTELDGLPGDDLHIKAIRTVVWFTYWSMEEASLAYGLQLARENPRLMEDPDRYDEVAEEEEEEKAEDDDEDDDEEKEEGGGADDSAPPQGGRNTGIVSSCEDARIVSAQPYQGEYRYDRCSTMAAFFSKLLPAEASLAEEHVPEYTRWLNYHGLVYQGDKYGQDGEE